MTNSEVARKLAALRLMTVVNGATVAEAETAARLAVALESKYGMAAPVDENAEKIAALQADGAELVAEFNRQGFVAGYTADELSSRLSSIRRRLSKLGAKPTF